MLATAKASPLANVPAALAYPNPAEEAIRLELPAAWPLPFEAQLLDAAGRVVRTFRPAAHDLSVPRGTLQPGVYLLKFAGQPPVRIEFK